MCSLTLRQDSLVGEGTRCEDQAPMASAFAVEYGTAFAKTRGNLQEALQKPPWGSGEAEHIGRERPRSAFSSLRPSHPITALAAQCGGGAAWCDSPLPVHFDENGRLHSTLCKFHLDLPRLFFFAFNGIFAEAFITLSPCESRLLRYVLTQHERLVSDQY